MRKLLLLSLVMATIFIPLLASRERSATRAFRKTLLLMGGFFALYLLALRFLYSRFG
jgi:hypothetical protein